MKKNKDIGFIPAVKLLWHIANKKERFVFFLLLLGSIVRACSELTVPLVTACIIQKLSGEPASILGLVFPENLSTISLIIICFSITFALYALGTLIRTGVKYFSSKIRIKTNVKAVEYLLANRKNFSFEMTNGEVSYIVKSACDNVAAFIETSMIKILCPVLTAAFAVVYIASINLYCFLIMLATIILLFCAMLYRVYKDKKAFKALENINGNINNHVLNNIENLPFVAFFKAKALEIKISKELNKKYFKEDKKRLCVYLIYWMSVYIIEFSCMIAVPLIILQGPLSSAKQASMLIIVIPYIVNVLSSIESLSFLIGECQQQAINISRLTLIKANPENLISQKEKTEISEINKIEIKNLNYEIGTFSKTYQNVCFYKGKLNCIAGESGGGKTSLINALLGLKEYKSGEIIINDETKLQSLFFDSDKISLSFQGDNFFDRSVVENIMYPDMQLSDKAASLLKKFDLKYLLEREESDSKNSFKNNLSGGERKRISVIRAISKDAQVYILDEPTNELDEKNVKHVIKELVKLSKQAVVIVISHDKRLLEQSENIIII